MIFSDTNNISIKFDLISIFHDHFSIKLSFSIMGLDPDVKGKSNIANVYGWQTSGQLQPPTVTNTFKLVFLGNVPRGPMDVALLCIPVCDEKCIYDHEALPLVKGMMTSTDRLLTRYHLTLFLSGYFRSYPQLLHYQVHGEESSNVSPTPITAGPVVCPSMDRIVSVQALCIFYNACQIHLYNFHLVCLSNSVRHRLWSTSNVVGKQLINTTHKTK